MKQTTKVVPRKTIILGYKVYVWEKRAYQIPIIKAFRLSDFQIGFFCDHCKKLHRHGLGDGHRASHCSKETTFTKTGYILQEDSHEI